MGVGVEDRCGCAGCSLGPGEGEGSGSGADADETADLNAERGGSDTAVGAGVGNVGGFGAEGVAPGGGLVLLGAARVGAGDDDDAVAEALPFTIGAGGYGPADEDVAGSRVFEVAVDDVDRVRVDG